MTAFNTWMTRFDEAATLVPTLKSLPLREQMARQSKALVKMAESGSMDERDSFAEILRLGEEYLWLLDGKPYYNVHPKLVSQLCNCKLDKLPASYLEVPGGFDTVLIRFSDPAPELSVNENEYVRSILIGKDTARSAQG